ncbi:MAG: HprK-related kinase B [Pseudomonadota bacterium]
MSEIAALARELRSEQDAPGASLFLDLGGYTIAIGSNSDLLLQRLGDYFAEIVCRPEAPDIVVEALEGPPLGLPYDFSDWRRDPGKVGRKDSFYDLPGARLIRKVRTGMVFLQSQDFRIASGPCLANDNQVINFVINQYMTWLQQQEWLICHAAALGSERGTLALAGLSGGGKSTLMLRAMEQSGTTFISNDRLFLKREGSGDIEARGVPKMPRINPGTIVNNPRLWPLVSDEQRAGWAALPPDQLWPLEEKYDAPIAPLFGQQRSAAAGRLLALLILNWRWDDPKETRLAPVSLAERPDLLPAIMKSPGPFYQLANGSFHDQMISPDPGAYLDLLSGTPVFEASGRADFDLAQRFIAEHILCNA